MLRSDNSLVKYVDFETVSAIGSGSQGKVFKVTCPELERFAMKVVSVGLPGNVNNADLEKVQKEVATLRKLDHQNIIKYICSFEEVDLFTVFN